ncbi:UDP-2,3-diacylglucosamine diphosphatase [bacterium]|nr:UDP-2,3-diacylglucosamine diphosphatase [bacterium]
MKSSYFISDIHLGTDTEYASRTRLRLLLDFFAAIEKDAEHLFIVGDLFDFWFEYKSVMPKGHFDLLYALKKMRDAGTAITLLRGNHDFWIAGFFEDELGIPVHDDFLDIRLGGKRFYISHGDGLAKDDKGYRFLKKILRNPFNIRLFSLLHPDIGHALATFSSRLSRDYSPILDDREDYMQFAREMFGRDYDCVVLGHTHAPVLLREAHHVYLNTGDWMSRFTYGKFTDGRLTLEHWPLPEQR